MGLECSGLGFLEPGQDIDHIVFSFSRLLFQLQSWFKKTKPHQAFLTQSEFFPVEKFFFSHLEFTPDDFPTGGLKASIGLTQTGEPFGGNVRLREYRFLYQQFWSLNLDSTLILMAKAQWGMLQQQGGTRIPAEDRYRIGGMNSIRAHPYYVIAGPFSFREQALNQETRIMVDENGYQQLKIYDKRTVGLSIEELDQLESGGVYERIFNLELLFPLSRDEKSFIRGVVFADAGNVNAETFQYRLLGEREPGFFDMRKSAGAGVRVITPMGVLRFEYGMKLDARDGESPDRFEFTVSGLF